MKEQNNNPFTNVWRSVDRMTSIDVDNNSGGIDIGYYGRHFVLPAKYWIEAAECRFAVKEPLTLWQKIKQLFNQPKQ